MQTALDSTALMLSKEAATDTDDQLKANAFKYFTSLFVRPEAKDITINVAYTTEGGSKIVINATAAMPADFTKLLGYDNFTILASSTAKWGTTRLRVALVLDNTGSMADDGKMAALKTATKGLLTQFQGAVTHCRRRLCLDHSVREGREPWRRELEFGLDLLGQPRSGPEPNRQHLVGSSQRRLQQHHV